MNIEKHAEAAAEEIVERYDEPHFDFVYESIAKHMQAAIDEATAPLKARIAELEGLGPLIEEVKRRAYSTGTQRAIGDNEWPLSREKMREAEAQIDAILKGENAACDAVEGE